MLLVLETRKVPAKFSDLMRETTWENTSFTAVLVQRLR